MKVPRWTNCASTVAGEDGLCAESDDLQRILWRPLATNGKALASMAWRRGNLCVLVSVELVPRMSGLAITDGPSLVAYHHVAVTARDGEEKFRRPNDEEMLEVVNEFGMLDAEETRPTTTARHLWLEVTEEESGEPKAGLTLVN